MRKRHFREQQNDEMIEGTKNFKYEAEEDVTVKIDLESGKYTTNCIKCNMTCHYQCKLPNDEQKMNCAAMKNRGEDNVTCEVCPGECHWSGHHNASYRLDTEKKIVKKTAAKTLARHKQAITGKGAVEAKIKAIEKEINEEFKEVFKLVQQANVCMKELDKIALRPNHLSDEEYILSFLLMPRCKKRNRDINKGYQQRIKYYRELQKRARVLKQSRQAGEKNIKDDELWKLFEDGSSSPQ